MPYKQKTNYIFNVKLNIFITYYKNYKYIQILKLYNKKIKLRDPYCGIILIPNKYELHFYSKFFNMF
jgi:hypothetical protein